MQKDDERRFDIKKLKSVYTDSINEPELKKCWLAIKTRCENLLRQFFNSKKQNKPTENDYLVILINRMKK